jgi:Kef-type K+ transport system membrane component KefB
MDWLAEISQSPFYEFAFILLLAAVLGGIGQLLRQPLIVMFIALGIIVGPSALDVVESVHTIELLAKIGIAVLLFIVGLKLDIRIINSVGKVALMTGLGQVIFTSLFGFLIAWGLGSSPLASFYIAVALTFSSTIIIIKLLSDKKEIDTLHGRIAVGFLIVQDLVVVLIMIVISSIGQGGDRSLLQDIGRTLLTGGFLIGLTLAMMRWVIPMVSRFLARSQELLTLLAIAWALTMAAMSDMMDFSAEVGAFLAGISLASSQFKDVIGSRLTSLRDFLLLFFFVNLGVHLDLGTIGESIGDGVVLSLFVLIGNPIIVLIIMGMMGYRKRTAFLAGLTVAQISEFSLIFAGLGLQVGHIDEEVVGLITLVGLITIALSTYLILYSHRLYGYLAPFLEIFERKTPYSELDHRYEAEKDPDVIVFGLGRFGGHLLRSLQKEKELNCLGVDFDPEVVRDLQSRDRPVLYGDIEDSEILELIPYRKTRSIVITIPESEECVHLIERLRREGFEGRILMTVRDERRLSRFFELEALDEVLMPYRMAAKELSEEILERLKKEEEG